jgi:hypothetical protein
LQRRIAGAFGVVALKRTVGKDLAALGYGRLSVRPSSGKPSPGWFFPSSPHAVLILDGAGWHGSAALVVRDNLSLLTLPPCSPELNPVENIRQNLRANWRAISVFDSHDASVEACCAAWNRFASDPKPVTSITSRAWAHVNCKGCWNDRSTISARGSVAARQCCQCGTGDPSRPGTIRVLVLSTLRSIPRGLCCTSIGVVVIMGPTDCGPKRRWSPKQPQRASVSTG